MLFVVVKNQNLFKKKEAKGLLSSLGLKTPLNKIPLLDLFLISRRYIYA